MNSRIAQSRIKNYELRIRDCVSDSLTRIPNSKFQILNLPCSVNSAAMRIGAGLTEPVLTHPLRRGAVAAVAAGLEPRVARVARPLDQGRQGVEQRRLRKTPPFQDAD